jgi:hypothetical protein
MRTHEKIDTSVVCDIGNLLEAEITGPNRQYAVNVF